MLSRKVVTRSGRGFRGYYPSKKLNRMVQFESLLERDAIKIFEHTNEVISFKEQPIVIHYHQDLEPKKYYPDFELQLNSGEIIHVEVKPTIHLEKLINKYQAINQHYQSRTEYFVVLTEKELRSENLKSQDFYTFINTQYLIGNIGERDAEILI